MAVCLRIALSGMREAVCERSRCRAAMSVFLRWKSSMTWTRRETYLHARGHRARAVEHVALPGAAAGAARIMCLPRRRDGLRCWRRRGWRKRIGAKNLCIKNDAVCLPTLSFKDRVVSVALANAKIFGFDTVGCSSTGNLANAVAAQAARLGFKTYILVPADLEPAKILNTQVYGATLVRIEGNYDHVNRLSSQIAERYNWGFVNVNLRPYYAEGSKTVGYEIAEQLGWRLPDNVVVPMAGGSLITKIRKAFNELIELGLVEEKPVRFFGAQATGCSPIAKAVKNWHRSRSSRSGRIRLRARWRSAIPRTGRMRRGRSARAADGLKMFPTWRLFRRSRNWRRPKASLPKRPAA